MRGVAGSVLSAEAAKEKLDTCVQDDCCAHIHMVCTERGVRWREGGEGGQGSAAVLVTSTMLCFGASGGAQAEDERGGEAQLAKLASANKKKEL